jgi:hypothetical protein
MRYSAVLLVAALMLTATPAMANKVTGSVADVTDSNIVVKKGKQKLDIARDANTRVEGDLRKGAKVTVEYTMTATSIEAKPGRSKARAKTKKQD